MKAGSMDRSTCIAHRVGTDAEHASSLGIDLPGNLVRFNHLIVRLRYALHVLTNNIHWWMEVLVKLLRLNHRRYMRHIVGIIDLSSIEFGLWPNIFG